jgi:hypothetical protein
MTRRHRVVGTSALAVLVALATAGCGQGTEPELVVVVDFTGTYGGTAQGSENGVTYAGKDLVITISQLEEDSLAGAWTFGEGAGTLAGELERDDVAGLRLTQILPCAGEYRGSIRGAHDAMTGEVQLIYGHFGGESCIGTPTASTVFAEFVLPRQ